MVGMINAADEQIFRTYLQEKNLLSDPQTALIRPLGGGVSCEAIMVRGETKAFVVKQALAKLRVKEDWFSDVTRIITEKDCLAFYNKIVPEHTPELLFYDEENYLYGMEAAPESARMWKDELLGGKIDFAVAEKVACALAKVHNASARDQAVQQRFASQTFFIELRVDPYLTATAKRHPALAKRIEQESARLLDNKLVLVHGDYSPKNILVDGQKIFILDFEVAHIGDPSFDLAFLTNHFILKAVKHKQWSPSFCNLATYAANVYLGKVNFMERQVLEKNSVRTLALLFLARVDGKSLAEYITQEADKRLIRKISYGILDKDLSTYRELAGYVQEAINTNTP